MLTPNELSAFKSILLHRKDEIQKELEATDYFQTKQSHVQDSVGELSRYDNHPGDTGTELYEREKDIALVEHYEKELKDITHALENIEKGAYGKCETCDKDISLERLKALPTATHCVEHSPDQNVSHRRPVEEEVLIPAYGKFEYDEKDATLYDAEDAWQDVSRFGSSESPSDFFDQSILDYNDIVVEEDERIGYVEDIESFVGTDIEGNNIQIYPNAVHQAYEEQLDSEGIVSAVGNIGHPELESFDDE
ncbi:TraR/DksA C4-type zinc finger protein [Calidifontibacillus oryziterrae]|uniref:TraR/DksA C4-type zinc finger protein n=1 Tax=Calidifontibacillus oryziterrae TaxID=1191699 RepID=UPI0002DCC588|nr:TraR/DksA C4-type zinc finger protein [Calidifontibacillus oryziterrae]